MIGLLDLGVIVLTMGMFFLAIRAILLIGERYPRLGRLPTVVKTFLSAVAILSAVASFFTAAVWLRNQIVGSPPPSLERDVAQTLKALDENSRTAVNLLARMQGEVAERRRVIEELGAQRSVLELTAEQKRAIEQLLQRPKSIGEMLRSPEFWVGSVAVNAVFYLLGLATPWLVRRWGRRLRVQGENTPVADK